MVTKLHKPCGRCSYSMELSRNATYVAQQPLTESVGFSPGGYSHKNLVGVCGPLPKTLTLFMTKICDFPYPIYDRTKNFIPYL